MRYKKNAVTVLLALATVWGGWAVDKAIAIEKLTYKVIEKQGEIEIREYQGYIEAQTVVNEEFTKAGNKAFSRLFDYISGKNETEKNISMTAPVNQQKTGKKIAMTAPVNQQAQQDQWVISFVMPKKFTMETLPKPQDDRITLVPVQAYRAAAIRYSGFWSKAGYQKHLDKLQKYMTENNLEAEGEPTWARYNSPFSLWFLRRNEVIINLKKRGNTPKKTPGLAN